MIEALAFAIPVLRPWDNPCFGSKKYFSFSGFCAAKDCTRGRVWSEELLSTTSTSKFKCGGVCESSACNASLRSPQRLYVLIIIDPPPASPLPGFYSVHPALLSFVSQKAHFLP